MKRTFYNEGRKAGRYFYMFFYGKVLPTHCVIKKRRVWPLVDRFINSFSKIEGPNQLIRVKNCEIIEFTKNKVKIKDESSCYFVNWEMSKPLLLECLYGRGLIKKISVFGEVKDTSNNLFTRQRKEIIDGIPFSEKEAISKYQNPIDCLSYLLFNQFEDYVQVHGDFNLDNIRLNPSRDPQLIDFYTTDEEGHIAYDAAKIETEIKRHILAEYDTITLINLEESLYGGEWGDLPPSKLLFSIDLKFQTGLNSGITSEDLLHEFEEKGITLSQNAIVSIEEEDSRWLITNGVETYNVKKEDKELKIYQYNYSAPDDKLCNIYRVIAEIRNIACNTLNISEAEYLHSIIFCGLATLKYKQPEGWSSAHSGLSWQNTLRNGYISAAVAYKYLVERHLLRQIIIESYFYSNREKLESHSITMYVGETVRFSAIGEDEDGDKIRISPTWSLNGTPQTTSTSWDYTPTIDGVNQVTATIGEKSSSVTVEVLPLRGIKITIQKS